MTATAFINRMEEEYRQRTPRSEMLHARARQVMPGGDTRTSTFFRPYPIVIKQAEGRFLHDADGNQILDFMNNATSLIHGHAFPPVVDAVHRQVAQGTAWGPPSEHQIALASLLCERTASVEHIRFTNSGTEATMMAIRAARAYTGRDTIIKIEGGYHGTHDAVSISVFPSADQTVPASPPAGIPAGIRDHTLVVSFNDAEALEQLIQSHRDTLAAVIVEPLLGSHGMVTATRNYLQAVRRLTAANDILLILDEVQTLRLDAGGAQVLYDVVPDLTAMAKIIGGGFPVGAFGGRADIMQMYDPASAQAIGHGGTFNGNPVTMAAGLAAMEHLTPERIAHINKLGDILHAGLQDVFVEQGLKGQVTGKGSLVGFHFLPDEPRDGRDAQRAPALLKHFMFLACLNRGLLVSGAANLNVSTIMTREDIDRAIRIFQDALRAAYPLIEQEYPHLLL